MALTEEELREELELAMMDVLDGGPFTPLLASKIRRTAEDTLRRLRLRGKVEVLDGGRHVRIGLIQGSRVKQVNLWLARA